MKGDVNDTLQKEGVDGVLKRQARARPLKDYDTANGKGNGADTEPLPIKYSEDALAAEFETHHGEGLRYVAQWHQWRAWTGTHWQSDKILNVYARARRICREAAERAKHEFKGAAGIKLARVLSANRTVAAVEVMTRSDQRRIAATIEQWDMNPWLLNTPGGTVDLRIGELRSHDRHQYLTKLTAVMPAPKETLCPLWTKFLDKITAADAELAGFLQRYIGYCLTGLTNEHAFVFACGGGANGKGTFINTLSAILKDYACVAPMTTFLASKQEQHPTDIAKLCGARFVSAQETQKGRRWDETKLKALTGGDRLTGRFMRQDFWDFDPTHKLFIAGNHKPRLVSVDEAMRRRLILVPFKVQIQKAERDTNLLDKLEPEWPAILRWAIEGCLAWQERGLDVPSVIRDATNAYLADQDTIDQWLDECIRRDAGEFAFTLSTDLFASWRQWCEHRNLPAGSQTSFSESLADNKGLTKKRNNTGRMGFSVEFKSVL
jgi:putative DNA primase/helicase